jgi:hypothetical protein
MLVTSLPSAISRRVHSRREPVVFSVAGSDLCAHTPNALERLLRLMRTSGLECSTVASKGTQPTAHQPDDLNEVFPVLLL